MCCAVGFDSYVIIRHGVPSEDSKSSSTTYKNLLPGNKLGCYFCNDVVAPGDVRIIQILTFLFQISFRVQSIVHLINNVQ